jgi:sugar lactone lactonase YvrE
MKLLRLVRLALLVVAIPSTAAAPIESVTALAPLEVRAAGFLDLRGVAVDADGTVYVTDRAAGTVTRIAPDRSRATVAAGLDAPVGVAVDVSGRLVVAEEGAGRIVEIDSRGHVIPIASGLVAPQWLAVSDTGRVYVTAAGLTRPGDPPGRRDTGDAHMIVAIDAGREPSVLADRLNGLRGLHVSGGVLYAATRSEPSVGPPAGAIVQITIRDDGRAAPVAEAMGALPLHPIGLGQDGLGAWLVTTRAVDARDDPVARTLSKVALDGTRTQVAAGLVDPQGVAFDRDGSMYVTDGTAGRLLRLQAPPAPTLDALPAWTNASPVAVSATTQPGAQVDLFVADATDSIRSLADVSGKAVLSVSLPQNQQSRLTLFATGAGGAGLTSVATEGTVIHDRLAPAVDVRVPPPGAFVRQRVPVEVRVLDGGSGVERLELDVDGRRLSSTLTPPPPASAVVATSVWDTTGIADGSHTLSATATDRAGNGVTVQRVVLVDNRPPSVRITESRVAGITATVAFTGTDNLTAVERLVFAWRLDGGLYSAFSSATTVTVRGLAAGRHTFEVTARDLAGNEAVVAAAQAIETTPADARGADMGARATGELTLTLAPADGIVVRGSTTTFTVSASAPGAGAGRIALAIAGLPDGATGTFAPSAIAGGRTSTLVIRAAPTTVAATTSFTVTGSGRAGRETIQGSASGSLTVLADGRTTLIGRIVDTHRNPLRGVEIAVGEQRALTDASGNFVLLDPPEGEQVVLIDGDPASDAERHYPTIPATVTIVAGRTNELPYVPHLHEQKRTHFTRIDHGRETVVTDPDVPGVVLRLPPGTPIVGWDGRAAEQVSIRTVPIDRLPVRPLPSSVRARTVYMFYFGKRGGGIPSRPVPFEAPNEQGLRPGAKANLWYFDESPRRGEAPNDWRIAGTGTVSADGRTIVTDPGVGIPKFCCGAALFDDGDQGQDETPGPTSQKGQDTPAADPVDLATGIFTLTRTDLALSELPPLALTRTYRSGATYPGPFGLGSLTGYEDFLQRTSPTVITYVYGAKARTVFVQQPDGSFTNTTVPALRGTTITAHADGTYTLREKDGGTIGFDNEGLQVSRRDRHGNAVTVQRAWLTNVTGVVAPSGRARR